MPIEGKMQAGISLLLSHKIKSKDRKKDFTHFTVKGIFQASINGWNWVQ